MTYMQPSASTPSARIRILGCDPPPPPRRPVNWALLIACAAAAVAGVLLAALARHLFLEPTSARPGVADTSVGIGSRARAAATVPADRPYLRRAVRNAATPVDLRRAARTEPRARPAATATPPAPAIAVPADAPAPAAPAAPADTPPPAPVATPGRVTTTGPEPAVPRAPAPAPPVRDTLTRPDLPPDPTDPNSQIGQP